MVRQDFVWVVIAYQFLYITYDFNGLCYIESTQRKPGLSKPAFTFQYLPLAIKCNHDKYGFSITTIQEILKLVYQLLN